MPPEGLQAAFDRGGAFGRLPVVTRVWRGVLGSKPRHRILHKCVARFVSRLVIVLTDKQTKQTDRREIISSKQIERQSVFVSKRFSQDKGPDRPCQICLLSSLITVQNLFTVSHTVCAHVGSPKIWG